MNSAKSKWRLAPLAVVIAGIAAVAAFLLGGMTLSPAPQPAAAVTQQEFTITYAAGPQNATKVVVVFKKATDNPALLDSAKVITDAAGCDPPNTDIVPGVAVVKAEGKVTVDWDTKCVRPGDSVTLGVVDQTKDQLWIIRGGATWFNGTNEIPPNTSGISCTDVYLSELQVPLTKANPYPTPDLPVKPAKLGEPPWREVIFEGLLEHTAIALTRGVHDTSVKPTDNQIVGVTEAMNQGIPGAIAGSIPALTVPKCAKVDKQVAEVTSVAGTATEPVLDINATEDNKPQPGMPVYWKSTDAGRAGFYVVTATDRKTTATLKETVALCNAPPAGVTANGTLHSCIPDNKGFSVPPLAYTNAGVMVGGVLSRDPFTVFQPRENGGEYDCSAGCRNVYEPDYENGAATVSISCSPGTGAPEDPANPVGVWTRLESRTISSQETSQKIPSYGQTQYYTKVVPKTCEDLVGTKRSTTVNVTWSLDSASRDGPDPATDGWNSDWDKDGCLDWQELASPKPIAVAGGGGRDAFNPYDCQRNLEGIWSVTATAVQITLGDNKADYTNVIPGAFYRCRAHFQHDKGNNNLTVPIYCYIDIPNVIINPEDEPTLSGDGLGGDIYPIGLTGMPPPPYGDMDSEQTVLTGSYNKGTDSISLTGCFKDLDGAGSLGNVWIETQPAGLSVLTGYGFVNIWILQNPGQPDCLPSPTGDATVLTMQIGIQAGKIGTDESAIDAYDYDLDGCPDKKELSDNPGLGGLRDPFNPWDFYDVNGDLTINLFDDIFGVAFAFGTGAVGRPNQHDDYDRILDRGGAMTGSNAWNQKPPDGKIDLFNDIFGVAFQFGHRCN